MVPRSALLALFFALFTSTQAAVLAVDYGSDWIKASVPKPGSRGALDVLLNRDSKRKIQSIVAWNKEERVFGTDGFNLAARFPADSFRSLKYLQGSAYGGSKAKFFSEITGLELVETDRHTTALRRPDGSEWSAEELIAMQLQYVKDLAEEFAEEPVTDIIMTVPPFYTQFERQAVLDAIEIAGMKSVALVSDGAAVAINYAIVRSFPEKENHIIYDAGASSITASVVSMFTGKLPDPTKVLKSSLKNATAIHVKGIGYDVVASGTELDRRLRDMLVEIFEKQVGKSVKDNARAMARLWKEAGRVKNVLSANADSSVTVESLAFDKDFKSTISRSTFEKAAEDLVPRYTQPIMDALAAANMTMSDINSVILTGGASRIPMVRSAVKNFVGEEKIALNVNADEAAVLGAAFYGATLSGRFQSAKKFDVRDVVPHDILLSYTADKKSDKTRVINSLIYPSGSRMGGPVKSIKFPNKNDFQIAVKYKNPGSIDFPQEIYEAHVTGVIEAFANLTKEGVAAPYLKVDSTMNEVGMVVLSNAVARGEATVMINQKEKESLFDKMKNFVGGESSSSESSSETTSTSASSSGATDSATTTSTASTTTTEKPKPTSTTKMFTVPLSLEIKPLSIPPINPDAKVVSRQRLAAIKEAELARHQHAEAMNHLEGYLYRLRDLLEGDSTTPFMEFSQPEERDALAQKAQDAVDWFNAEAQAAQPSEIWKKREELELVESTVINRYKEAKTGPKALQNLQKALYLGRQFVLSGRENRTIAEEAGEPTKYTEEEFVKLETLLQEHEDWLREKIEEQKLLPKRSDAVLKTKDMDTRGTQVQRQVDLLNKRKDPVKKPVVTQTATSASESSTPTASAEQSSETETAPVTEEEPPVNQHERDEL